MNLFLDRSWNECTKIIENINDLQQLTKNEISGVMKFIGLK